MQNIPDPVKELNTVQLDEITSSEQQEIINNLLFIGMEDDSLYNKLRYSLKNIFTTPWLHENAELGVFVLIPDTNKSELKAHYNMQKSRQLKCLDSDYRHSLCHKAIQTGHSAFNTNHKKNSLYSEVEADFRPYYAIPVKSRSTVLAVLVIFLEQNHKQDIREIVFLRNAANVLTFSIGLYNTEERIHRLAHYDPLTQLPNKKLLKQRLNKILSEYEASNYQLTVLFFALDGLKRINDSMGHHTGDDVLNIMSQRLQHCAREIDIVCRWGSDEFVIVLTDIKQSIEVTSIIEKVFQRFQQPISLLEQKQLVVSTSIGISSYPADGDNAMTLVQNAAMAMNKAKSEGGNCHQYYTADMNFAVIERLSIETGLRTALEDDQFELYYQPLVDLETHNIIGAEALIRWNQPNKGLIDPDKFIPIAEDSGLIIPIGEWVLTQACSQCKEWQQQGLKNLSISVNLSAKQFRNNNLPTMVSDALNQTGLEPSLLTLELTESAIMANVNQTIESLHMLKDLGLSLSIDDFGTGYSSLAYLKRFPIDKLKIDRSFVQDVDINADDKAIVKSIIALGHSLKLSIVAEGVEKREHMNLLDSLNCEESQGYYISKPIPAGEFKEFVRHWQQSSGSAK